MSDKKDEKKPQQEEHYSLNDDRRVKVLSPGALVAKRFFRNRLAVLGMIMLLVMFVFSFVGGLISPYGQDEQFYTYEDQNKEYAGVVRNNDFRYDNAEGQEFTSIQQAQFMLAYGKMAPDAETADFEYKDVQYTITREGTDLYSISSKGTLLAIAYKDIVNSDETELGFDVKYAALKAYTNDETAFSADGAD